MPRYNLTAASSSANSYPIELHQPMGGLDEEWIVVPIIFRDFFSNHFAVILQSAGEVAPFFLHQAHVEVKLGKLLLVALLHIQALLQGLGRWVVVLLRQSLAGDSLIRILVQFVVGEQTLWVMFPDMEIRGFQYFRSLCMFSKVVQKVNENAGLFLAKLFSSLQRFHQQPTLLHIRKLPIAGSQNHIQIIVAGLFG